MTLILYQVEFELDRQRYRAWVPMVWWFCRKLGGSIWCIWLKFMHSCTAKFETSYFCKGTQHLVLLFPPENTRDGRFSVGFTFERCAWGFTYERFWPESGPRLHHEFCHQKNSDHPISSRDKPIQRGPVDSAYFCLHRGLGLEPVCIASSRDTRSSCPIVSMFI